MVARDERRGEDKTRLGLLWYEGGKKKDGTEEEEDLALKCIAPIRIRDFGRVESQLLFPFFSSLFSFSRFIFFAVLFELLTSRPGKTVRYLPG